MLTNAASTIRPIKVLIIGSGVAGGTTSHCNSQAPRSHLVSAYDLRPEAREQVESLGEQMVNLSLNASGSDGYAPELTAEEERQQQQAELEKHISGTQVSGNFHSRRSG